MVQVIKAKFILSRSSHQKRSVKSGGLKNFANFTRKHLGPATLLKGEQMFLCEICEIFKNTYIEELTPSDYLCKF